MSDRFYTGLIVAAALFAWMAFFSLVFLTDPVSSGFPELGIFYASLMLGLIGLMILGRIGLIYWRRKEFDIGSGLYFFYCLLASAFLTLMLYFSHLEFLSFKSAAVAFAIFAGTALLVWQLINRKKN